MTENNIKSTNNFQQQSDNSPIIHHHIQKQQQQHSTNNNNNNSHNEALATIVAQQHLNKIIIKQEIKMEPTLNTSDIQEYESMEEDGTGVGGGSGSGGIGQQQQRISIIGQQNYTNNNNTNRNNNQQLNNINNNNNEQNNHQQYESINTSNNEQQHNQYYITSGNNDNITTTDVIRNNNHPTTIISSTSTATLPSSLSSQQTQNYLTTTGSGGSNSSNNNNNNNSNGSGVSTITTATTYSKLQNVRNTSPTTWHQPISQAPISHHHQQQQQQQQQNDNQQIHNQNAFGMLRHENDILYITENCIEIGRNSSTSSVHFHVAKNSFVSRKHFQVLYEQQTGDFFVTCLSKNGVFVDDIFQRRNKEPMKLPKICTFRFPSTEIRISFESFTDKSHNDVKNNFNNKNLENSNVIYSPLKISIPKTEQKSPFPSPTGTMSAANSCPTSPRQGFQEYQTYNNYNNNNNNLQNEFFQPPPASSSYNEHEKPPYSYAQLIVQSISAASDKQLTLSGIYSFISKHYPYYRKEANKGWQNSIRHNLSLNRYFIKVARSQDEPGKGSFWRIDPNSEAKLIDQSYKKRRQRGNQCFRPPYGMPRSAPVSPSHMDNSRESSPLHDIVLQSAPGSPGMSYQNHGDNHGHDDVSFENSNVIQQSSYNSHNQYNNPFHGNGSGGGNSTTSTNPTLNLPTPGNTINKRNHHQTSSSSAHQISSGHSDIYDDIPDYSSGGGVGADIDECDSTMKRPKYSSELNQ